MWNQFWRQVKQRTLQDWGSLTVISAGVAGWVIVLKLTGVFQLLDFRLLDQFFRWRSQEAVDQRIVVVKITEEDIRNVGKWPIPDQILSELLEKIQQQQPRVIGIDIYRDLPVEPGHQKLVQTFESYANIIGIEKVAGGRVPPPPALVARDQVGFSDIVPDVDGRVRRGLMSIEEADGQHKLGLATRTAMQYLSHESIAQGAEEGGSEIRLGQSIFLPFKANDGGYVNADDGGYQVLLNYRGFEDRFLTTSMTSVLRGDIPANLMRDRLVLIGSTAESLRDEFQTPLGQMSGIVVHANLASQTLGAALDGRLLLRSFPDLVEWLWICAGASLGTAIVWRLLQIPGLKGFMFPFWVLLTVTTGAGGTVLVSYIAFLGGWWIPAVPALAALGLGVTVSTFYYSQKLKRLVATDGLTQVANRRYFDQYLVQRMVEGGDIALILCDVDHFKLYNDTYGHQAGDECLRSVAQAISKAVRRSDLVARYGGEEFAIVLAKTDLEAAKHVAERVVQQVRDMKMPHIGSKTSSYVTLSCGVASMIAGRDADWKNLIDRADAALYTSKHEGRDRLTLAPALDGAQ